MVQSIRPQRWWQTYSRWQWLVVSAVGLVALGLRLYKLDERSIWLDEAFGYLHSQKPISDIVLKPVCCHPPLHFVVIHGWSSLFGTSEIALRAPAVISGFLAVVGILWLGWRWFGWEAGLFAAALAAVASRLIYHSRELNPYGLVMFFAVILLGLFDNAWKKPHKRYLFSLGFAVLLALMTHYALSMLLVGLNAGIIYRLVLEIQSKPTQRRALIGTLLKIWLWQIPAVVVFVVYYISFTGKQIESGQTGHAEFSIGILDFIQRTYAIIAYMSVGSKPFSVVTLSLSALLVIGIGVAIRQRQATWLVVTLIGGLITSYFMASRVLYFYHTRYMLFIVPLMIILMGLGFRWICMQLGKFRFVDVIGRLGFALLLAAICLRVPQGDLDGQRTGLSAEQLHPVMACIEQHYEPGDRVFVYYGASLAFRYYNQRYQWPATVGLWKRGDIASQIADAEAALSTERGWIVAAHSYGSEPQQIEAALEQTAQRLVECQDVNAHAVLFERR